MEEIRIASHTPALPQPATLAVGPVPLHRRPAGDGFRISRGRRGQPQFHLRCGLLPIFPQVYYHSGLHVERLLSRSQTREGGVGEISVAPGGEERLVQE